MKTTRRLALAAAVLGLLAAAGPAKAAPVFSFESPGDVALSPTPAPGTWYPDRYAPSGFAWSAPGVVTESINSGYDAANRPDPYQGLFYNTQGRAYELVGGTNSISIQLYVDPNWQGLDQTVAGSSTGRLASFWAVGDDSSNNPVTYPIVEFNNNTDGNGASGFRVWNDLTSAWENVNGNAFNGYGQWYTLGISLVGSVIDYTIDGTLVGTDPSMGAVSLSEAILQGYNAGNSYDILWASSSVDAAAVPEPPTLIPAGIALVVCAGFVWTRRRVAGAAA